MDDPDLAPLIANSSYSLKEIVIMASLIEKETDGTDRTLISSVIHNRLENVGETAHLLQIDAPWCMPPAGGSPRTTIRPWTAL